MKLNQRDMMDILKFFPNIELSYEKNLHKKVCSSNIYLTIPKGMKYFAWFKNFKKKNICFFLHLDKRKKQIKNITVFNCCFDKELCCGKGTIIYGTIFTVDTARFFNIEDLFYFRGNNLTRKTQYDKLKCLENIFKSYIQQTAYTRNDIIFGLPIIKTQRNSLDKLIANLPYELYCIQHRLLFRHSTFLNEKIHIERNLPAVFLVKANVQTDIYDLFCFDREKMVQHTVACINDYHTSVLMNSIFRNIKENNDLDKLEESDDDEEFENINDDKYVDLSKEVYMKFAFIKKFGLWKPIELDKKENLSQIKDILRVEK